MTWKQDFNSNLKMKDLTGADYRHTRRVWEDFEIKKTYANNTIYMFKVIQYCQ